MNDPSLITTAVFDLGKVLLDFDYRTAARNLAPYCRADVAQIQALLDQSSLLLRYETGAMDRTAFFETVRDATGFTESETKFVPLFGDIFTPIEPMIDLHARLRASGFPTFIFSNTNDIAVEHIRETYPFFNLFSGYVFSYEHRTMKPDSAIYKIVEQATGCRGEEILYIDDRAENVAAARQRNWNTIHQTSPAETLRQINQLDLL